ncbi:MAG: MobV family relaxase [Acutalibacteraceae bacterium]
MAHLASFKSAGAVGVLRHDERTENDKVQSRKNECIDSKKTCLNYNLAPKRKGNLMEHIRQVCKDNNVRLSNRKDLNVMCSWIVTAPKTISKDQISRFFLYCYSFLKKRYGEEYTLSATVHMDETTPHLHYSFIPVGYDKKNNRLTVSSKLVATRTELRSFQQELSKALENEFGYDVGILNEATKDGNKEIQELKLQTAQKRIAEAEQSAERAEKHLNELQGRVLNQEEVNALRGKKTLTGGLKGINYEEYLSLVKTAQSVDKAKTAVISAQNETKQVKQELSSVQMKHRTEVAKLKSELENERRLREKERRYYKQIVGKLSPEAFEAFKQAEIELRTENSRRSAQQHKRGLIR